MTLSNLTHDAMRHALIAIADADNERYPQYAGYYDDWKLARVVKPITSKWGDSLYDVGEYVLVEPAKSHGYAATFGVPVIYCDTDHHWSKDMPGPTTGSNMTVNADTVEIVEAES